MDALPEDAKARKEYPLYRGLFKYFPKALCGVAKRSHDGGVQHGHSELHWDRSKSSDDADALLRHVLEGDWQGAAWRALACYEKHLEGGQVSVSPPIPKDVCVSEKANDDTQGWIEWDGAEKGEPDNLPSDTWVHIKTGQAPQYLSHGLLQVKYAPWEMVTAYKVVE